MVRLRPGAVLIHRPTGRLVKVIRITPNTFEVVTLDDVFGCKWELLLERLNEFEEVDGYDEAVG